MEKKLKIEILDKEYLQSKKWAEKIYIAYRQCYSGDETIHIPDDTKLFNFIHDHSNHASPLEHLNITVRVQGISRALSHQLVRHRIASYSQMSQRYVKKQPDFIIPPSINNNAEAKKIFLDTLSTITAATNSLRELGIPNEDSRYLYSNATETRIVITKNVRSWLHFFGDRCCYCAQWEIKNMADAILYDFKKLSLPFFDNAGPKCLMHKRCPELNCCGNNIKKIYVGE